MAHIRRPQSFARKIELLWRQRVFPTAPEHVAGALLTYAQDLIAARHAPPVKGRSYDWAAIALASGLERDELIGLTGILKPALDAIARHAREPREEDLAPAAPPRSTPRPARTAATLEPAVSAGARRGPKPRPVEAQPKPLFLTWEEPATLAEALTLHMARHGESAWHLHQAVVREGEAFDRKTIVTWAEGTRAPRSVESLTVLARIERRYRLPEGYFAAKLPNLVRAATGHDVGALSAAERRRLAWHLPHDFNSRPPHERQEILDWVQRVIISGATDYRRFQRQAMRQRYAIRFPGLAYGSGASSAASSPPAMDEPSAGDFPDPDLVSGVVDAPPLLAREMSELLSFKTATLTRIGLQRNGVWGEETANQKIEHLGLMFGALAASPQGEVKGHGVPLTHLTFGLLIFPGVWDWYVQWRERRRGFYTAWEVDMLRIAIALCRRDTGWVRQHPELLARVKPVPGLVTEDEIAPAREDWHGACDRLVQHASFRVREVARVARVHRDPFEPIMPILEADSPLGEYRKITEEIVARMPCERRYPRHAAEAARAFLMLRLGLHLGLRQKNLRQLLVCPKGQAPRSERRLEDLRRGELRWSERERGWEVLIPAVAFKNADSSFFGDKPFRLVLPDLGGLYGRLERYIAHQRRLLLGPAEDPGTLFVKTVKLSSRDASYDQNTFYEAWRLAIQRYGIFNPYTGRGAIKGLLPHGPHNVRDVLATHILKKTGSFEQASYAIQDTPAMVAQHYGRFLPQDKAALAARILNQVWAAA
jgi:hypothetical protein